jgi:spermidine/putrescine transport system ATP-binding protein
MATPDDLTINQATKTFTSAEGDRVTALDHASLDIARGEFFVLLGPSGCGKTTLLRAIAGLEPLDSGEIYLGPLYLDPLPPYKRPVNTVFQSYALFPHLSVWDNIAFGLKMDRKPRAEVHARVEAMLDLVRLTDVHGRKPGQLSGGQQQRIALARALAKQPQVLLLDEPLSALDLKLRRGMQGELKRIQRETGITFVFVTHDQEEALSLGDRIAVFDQGRPVQIGTPQEVYRHPANRFVADFIGDTNFVELPDRPGVDLAIRPENITLVPPGPGAYDATIQDIVYMGTDLRVTAQLAGGVTLRLRVSPPFPDLAPGQPVALSIPEEAQAIVN